GKIRTGFLVVPNCVKPVLVVFLGTRYCLFGLFIGVHLRLRNQVHLPSSMRSINDAAFVAHNYRARANGFLVRIHFWWARDLLCSAVPEHGNWSAVTFGRKLVTNNLTFGERVSLGLKIPVLYCGLDC